jgi:F-type H+-transporting ATPase subunit epsilon
MRLTVFMPTAVLVDTAARKITALAANGSFCLLPRHIDFVIALVPGILSFVDETGQEQFLAIDEGILVKCGDDVRVAVGRAVRGAALETLQQVVETEFQTLDDRERLARTALARLEANLVRGMLQEYDRP